MADNLDQCRAPHRKRRPLIDELRERRVVRMTWDIDPVTTSEMMKETGVSVFDDGDKMDMDIIYKPAPLMSQTALISQGSKSDALHHVALANTGSIFKGLLSLNKQDTYSVDNVECENVPVNRRLKRPIHPVDHINQLSDEILLHVLKWLTRPTLSQCLRVCKRWYHLSMDESLWRRLDLASKVIQPGIMGIIVDRGTVILRLARAEIKSPVYSHPYNELKSPKFAKLQYLDLTMAVVDQACLEELLSKCYLLKKLSLENCEINDAICRYIGQNTNLETLNLCMCEGITEHGLVPICNNLQRLDALNLSWTRLSRGTIVYLVTCLSPTLTKLELSGCKEVIMDEDVHQLCGSCPNLKELDLSDSTELTANSVQFIVAMLQGLEFLALSRCYNVAPISLLLLANLPCLLAFNVYGMLKEMAVQHLCEKLPNVQINKYPFSSIARPTTGIRRTSIWGLRVRDNL